jgi:hypothetical protein
VALAQSASAANTELAASTSGEALTAPGPSSEEPDEGPALPPRRTVWDFVKVLPIVFYTPETSLGLGAGLLSQFDMPGNQTSLRPSSVTLGGVYTLRGQILGQLAPELRFRHDDFVLKLDTLGARYPSRFYGIGNSTHASIYDTFVDCYVRSELDARMRPFGKKSWWRPLFVGVNLGAAWSRMQDPEAHVATQKSLFAALRNPGKDEVLATGFGPILAWDSRDSLNWPTKGSFLEAKSSFFLPELGGNVRYQRLALDLRHYRTLWLDHVLALHLVSQTVWGDVPFQRLPQLGRAKLFRGWYGGQLRENMLIAAEAEYRVPLNRRWALVAFGSVGRVAKSEQHFDPRELRGAGGGGLRMSVDKRDRVNVRLDLAYGDAFYPYLQFREAF